MGTLDTLIETLTPGRRIKSADHFSDRYLDKILGKPDVNRFLSSLPEDQKERAISTINDIVKQEYMKYGNEYFKRKSSPLRYLGLAAGVTGALSAIGAITGVLPLSLGAGAALYYGLGAIGVGGLVNTAADIYESRKAQEAIDGRLEAPEKLGYMRKTAKGIWDYVTTPARPTTYKSLYKNLGPLAEGLAMRALAYRGGYYIGQRLGPMGLMATYPAILVDFYRGKKKFDDRVIRKVQESAIEKFAQIYGLNMPMEARQAPGRFIPITADKSQQVYDTMQRYGAADDYRLKKVA